MRSIPSGRGFSVASQMLTVVKDGLVLNVDAGDTNSYPGTGVTWSDRSVQANSLTLTNGPLFTAATSTVGANIGFDGVDDYAQDNGNAVIKAISNGGDFTVDMWIKFNSAGTNQLVCGNTSTAIDGIGGFGLALVPSAGTCLIRINYKTTTSLFLNTTSTGLSTGTWRHIVVRFDYNTGGGFFNSNYNVYVNNSEFFSANNVIPQGTPASSNNFFRIGRRPNGTQPANINIGALKVYNRLLTTTEIAQNYNALRGRFGL